MWNEKEFSISGAAGIGKTHLMKFIMKHTLREYESACKLLGLPYTEFDIELTATTNKAADVLATATGFVTKTNHSFMNPKVKDNFKTGKSDIVRTKSWVVHHKKLISPMKLPWSIQRCIVISWPVPKGPAKSSILVITGRWLQSWK